MELLKSLKLILPELRMSKWVFTKERRDGKIIDFAKSVAKKRQSITLMVSRCGELVNNIA